MSLRVAIVGGGIAGLAAAYELEQQGRAGIAIEWELFEASERLGGIVETTRCRTAEGAWVLEGGPDGWVTEKPWARALAEELGLRDQVIACKEADKKTYVWLDGALVAMPDRMRMMVPEDLRSLEGSAMFSAGAKAAYARERERADELKRTAPQGDETVASFVQRHFGEEVLEKIAAPLLSGVFGGDVAKLSVRAVMAPFVRLEAEHGSLVRAMEEQRRARGGRAALPTFTSLRHGMGSLVEALAVSLPGSQVWRGSRVDAVERLPQGWRIEGRGPAFDTGERGAQRFDQVLLAVPVDTARNLLRPIDAEAAELVPVAASSAVLVCFGWSSSSARSFAVPAGFGFLVPQQRGGGARAFGRNLAKRDVPKLLAGTFVDQKFTDRVPAGARLMRVFFGGEQALSLQTEDDETVAAVALHGLREVLGQLPEPEPALTTVRRWPRSLPQYERGHVDRIQRLEDRVGEIGSLELLGNGYRGVGIPDLVRDARAAARRLGEVAKCFPSER